MLRHDFRHIPLTSCVKLRKVLPVYMSAQATRREIARSIRKNRLRKGLSQEACAAEVGVSRQMWHNYEAGKSVPVLARADRVAELLGMRRSSLDLPAEGPSRDSLALAELIERMVAEQVAARVGALA